MQHSGQLRDRKHSTVTQILLGIMLFTLSGGLHAADWKLDSSASTITFVAKSRLMNVDGVFKSWQLTPENPKGTLPADLSAARARVVVKVESIDTKNRRRDDHLRNADFFDVPKFPEAVFTLTGARVLESEGRVLAQGRLRIKDVERPVEVSFKRTATGGRLELSGLLKINRRDYHIDYDSVFNPIEDNVVLRLKFVFVPAS